MSEWDAAYSSMAEAVGRDVARTLSAAAGAEGRIYYDREADRAAAESYYDGVALAQLGELLRSTHAHTPRYKPSQELYPWVDLQPDGRLRSLYTGQEFEPRQLIEADHAIVRERAARMIRLRSLGTEEEQASLQDEVEAQLPFNCEHVVPQSWFEKQEPMRGDLHHLFACESRCNGFRGNTAFAEFADFPTEPEDPRLRAIRDDCGKSDAGGFEPAQGKGAAARAAFYFRTRYPEHIGEGEMPAERWQVLVEWHEQDPVTDWERHRNEAIFERQGNRNPFVDHPEWVAQLHG
jgi:endonuclease I